MLCLTNKKHQWHQLNATIMFIIVALTSIQWMRQIKAQSLTKITNMTATTTITPIIVPITVTTKATITTFITNNTAKTRNKSIAIATTPLATTTAAPIENATNIAAIFVNKNMTLTVLNYTELATWTANATINSIYQKQPTYRLEYPQKQNIYQQQQQQNQQQLQQPEKHQHQHRHQHQHQHHLLYNQQHPTLHTQQLQLPTLTNQTNYTFFIHQLQIPTSSSSSISSLSSLNMEIEMTFHQHCLAHRNSVADIFTLVLYSLVCIIGIFGNTLVIYVVLRFSKMQTVTNIYILNLAIADECFLIGIPFLLYTMRICSWRFGEFMCKAYMVSTSITQFTSSIFLLIMSADRYIAVCHPIASPRYRTLYIAKVVSAIAWLTSALIMLPVILFASTVEQEDGINYSCNIEWPEQYKKHSGTTFILYTFILGFATPLCFILCFYYLVIQKLRSVGPKKKSKEKKRTHRKVTRLVLTVITVYILCWLPHWISQVSLINSNPGQSELTRLEILIFLFVGCLEYSNSAMNPILYAFLSDNFRKSFTKAFTCMTEFEVNAQLHAEPSVFTKHGSRRRNSKRLINQKPMPIVKEKPTPNNNSSTTTSSTTTAEKCAAAAAVNNNARIANGRVVEHLIVKHKNENTICALFEKQKSHEAHNVLQTEL